MSNFGEGIIRETIQKLGDTLGFQMQIPDDTITNLGAVLQAQIGLLAELQSTGRLIPAGGMALTAEQVEDVRTVLNKFGFNQVTPEVIQAIEAAELLNRALFPASEPAEEVKPISWYRTMTPRFATEHFGFPDVTGLFERTHTASDGGTWGWGGDGDWELLVYPPAPAEPAEEETKAEYPHRGLGDLTVLGPEIFTNGEVINWRGENFVRQPDPASPPVVPTPTETGPWQHRDGRICVYAPAVTPRLRYRIGKFNDHGDFVHDDSERQLPEGFAPFVAAKEG